MLVKDIYNHLNSISPFELQESWDNSGLIVGDMTDSFKRIYISLDLDINIVDKLKPNSLVITHHPLIFKGVKTINNQQYSTKLLQKLIKKDIKLISMHTNIDKTHLNMFVGNEILGLDFHQVSDFVVEAKVDMSLDNLQKLIKEKLGIKYLKTVPSHKHIKSISLTTGAGASLLPYIKSDCFLTGDIKYHEAMEAKTLGVTLIDINHYESEQFFTKLLYKLLKPYIKEHKLKVELLQSINPFEIKK